MRTALCDRFGIDYPIFVFTPSEKVAAAVTRAGGMGVLGCVRFNHPEDLEAVLSWMDDNTLGKPYGVDVVMPATVPTEGTPVDIDKLIPQKHREFVDKTLAELDAFVRNAIAGYKVPRSLWIVDEIKRSPAGKPDYKWATEQTRQRPADEVHTKHGGAR